MPTGSLGAMFLPSRSQNFPDGIDVPLLMVFVIGSRNIMFIFGELPAHRDRGHVLNLSRNSPLSAAKAIYLLVKHD